MKLIGVIGTVSSYLANWKKRRNCDNIIARNLTKVGERKIKSRREKFLIFSNGITAIPSAHSAARVGKKNLAIVAMPLPKMKKKKNVTKSVKE